MEETIDKSTIRKFIHRIFRKSNDIGTLTVKSVREQFLKYTGKEKLDAEQKELFKQSVHDIYAEYATKQQGKSKEEESDVDDSVETSTVSDNDTTASSTSTSPAKKKRRTEISDKSDQDTANSNSNREEINNNYNCDTSTSKEKRKLKKKHSNIKASEDEDRKSDDVNNFEYKLKKRNVVNKKESLKLKSVVVSSDEEQASKKKVLNDNNAQVNSRKRKSLESSDEQDQENKEEEVEEEVLTTSNKVVLQRIDDEDQSENSSSSESVNEEQKQQAEAERRKSKSTSKNLDEDVDRPKKKKLKTKSKTSSGSRQKKKSSPPSEDSPKLHNLKRYARTCGMHFKYVDIFADCKSMSQKEKKLEKLIRDRTGFEGRITLQMCVKYKKKKEEDDEVAELDCRNIITTDGSGRRPTRSARSGSVNQPPLSTALNSEGPSVFSRLKGIVNSDESDSEDEKRSAEKRARNASVAKEDIYENKKKRPRVGSSSDEDDG